MPDLAYTWEKGSKPLAVLYLHGWTARRKSRKGDAVQEQARREKCHYLAFDYTAHGESGGKPEDFLIGQGIQDALDIIRETTQEIPLIIVGNSIGGWIGLQLAERLPNVVGFIGLAPAPDITPYIWDELLPDYARQALSVGKMIGPSPETFGFCFTPQLFQDAQKYMMLDREIPFNGPCRLLLGDQDERVHIDRLYRIKDCVKSENVQITLIKGANHHLSRDLDLAVIQQTISELIGKIL